MKEAAGARLHHRHRHRRLAGPSSRCALPPGPSHHRPDRPVGRDTRSRSRTTGLGRPARRRTADHRRRLFGPGRRVLGGQPHQLRRHGAGQCRGRGPGGAPAFPIERRENTMRRPARLGLARFVVPGRLRQGRPARAAARFDLSADLSDIGSPDRRPAAGRPRLAARMGSAGSARPASRRAAAISIPRPSWRPGRRSCRTPICPTPPTSSSDPFARVWETHRNRLCRRSNPPRRPTRRTPQ